MTINGDKSEQNSKREEYRLNKIIYFDEESVTDYLQIIAGGHLTLTTELLDSDTDSGEAGIESKVSVGIGKIFRSLIGLDASASVGANLKTKFQNDSLVRNILQNTILTDFLSIANTSYTISDEEHGIRLFEDYQIEVVEDSLSYIIMLSPYMTMLKDSSKISQDSNVDYDISIEKIDSAIRLAKGYFEFIGNCEGKKKVVFRFNIDAFKNNYKISDLLKMDLILYAVKVGKTTIDKMAIVADINAISSKQDDNNDKIDNPEFGVDSEISSHDANQELTVYDVLLAGVKEV